LSGRNLAENIQ